MSRSTGWNRGRINLGAAVVCGLLWGCDVREALGPTQIPAERHIGFVAGSVLDSRTLSGTPGARVEVVGLGRATTGTDGTWVLPNLTAPPADSFITIRAEAEGYVLAATTVDLRQGWIPSLLLTPLAAPTIVGPAGGTVSGSGGATVRIPAGALAAPVPITVTLLPEIAAQPIQTPDPVQGVAGLHLGPSGTHFAKAVEVMLPLLAPVIPKSRLLVLTLDESTLRWDSVGTAVLSEDGRLVTFSTDHFSLFQASRPSNSTRLQWAYKAGTTSPALPASAQETLAGCTKGPNTVPSKTVTKETSLSFQLGVAYVGLTASVTASIGIKKTISSVPVPIPAGSTVKVLATLMKETHSGMIETWTEELLDNKWIKVGFSEFKPVTYNSFYYDVVTQKCHKQ